MTPEEQRIAIAEAVGIEEIEFINAPNGGWFGSDREGNSVDLPDYLNDLNAIAEAEKIFDVDILSGDSPRYRYSGMLYRVCDKDLNRQPFRATAAQRAEAFLRTISKWKD